MFYNVFFNTEQLPCCIFVNGGNTDYKQKHFVMWICWLTTGESQIVEEWDGTEDWAKVGECKRERMSKPN